MQTKVSIYFDYAVQLCNQMHMQLLTKIIKKTMHTEIEHLFGAHVRNQKY